MVIDGYNGYAWLSMVMDGDANMSWVATELLMVMKSHQCYQWLWMVTECHRWLSMVVDCIIECYK